jgi:hypothetical protein
MSELIERVGADMLKALADLGEPDIDAGLGYLMGVEGVDVGSILARAAILATFEGMVPEGCAVSRDFVRTLEALKVVALEEKDAD